MADNTLINQITELDFTNLRESFKTYLASQDRFQDYDFEGSNLSVLIDFLAYHTHYDAVYLNQYASELYLGSSIRRNSVVARAKALGYLPRSARCSIAKLKLTLTPVTVGPPLLIPAGTRFQAEKEGTRYTFQTIEPTPVLLGTVNPGEYIVEDLAVYEGRSFTHVVEVTSDDLTVTIPNVNADTTTIDVEVDDIPYTQNTDIVDLDGESLVYFIDEIDNQRYKIYFGDGIIGKAVNDGDEVSVSYLVSSLDAPNGTGLADVDSLTQTTFTLLDAIDGTTDVDIVVEQEAQGGQAIESIDSIKLNAPLFNQAQGRAVTAEDYVQVVRSNLANIDSVIAWGGEDNVPVALGYVFLSVKPSGRLTLTESEKFDLETLIKENYAPLTVIPICVDPDFMYIIPVTVVKYNAEQVAGGSGEVRDAAIAAIQSFSDNDLESFNDYFRYSKLVREIDNSHIAITNSLTTFRLKRKFDVAVTGTPQDYLINFFNAIEPRSVRSDTFEITVGMTTYPEAFIKDTPTSATDGDLDLYYLVGVTETLVPGQIAGFGTVDYQTGEILLNDFQPDQVDMASPTQEIVLNLVPAANDVYPVRNVILQIDDEDITVTAQAD